MSGTGAASRKIFFVLPNRHGGGSERVVMTLLRHLNRDRFRLHRALVVDEGEFRSLVPDDSAPSETPFKEKGEGPHIVWAGRLGHQKGFDNLVRAFHDFRADYPRAELWILGTGPLLESLHELCERLGVAESVAFVGFRHDLLVWLKHADLFVLASRYEGLPNVLLEALACGWPVAATDCPGGTREIMELTGNENRLIRWTISV